MVESVDLAAGQARIRHEAIADYMPPMTMDFDAPDPKELGALTAGDSICFLLHVEGERAWIDSIQRSAPVPGLEQPLRSPANSGSELRVGDRMPEFIVKDTSGSPVSLSDLAGKTVALTFIYTRCPLPTYCPLVSHNFQVALGLVSELGFGDRCAFLSVSIDPEHDTPETLRAYAKPFVAEADGRWIFASPDESTLQLLGDACGLTFRKVGGQIDHNLRTVVIGPDQKISSIFTGNRWTPQELASEMRKAARRRSASPVQQPF